MINNFNPTELRTDSCSLWENFFIVERLKYLQSRGLSPNRYFWRTHQGKEIDYIEESGGKLDAFECKLNPTAKVAMPKEFASAYPNSEFHLISPENYQRFLVDD